MIKKINILYLLSFLGCLSLRSAPDIQSPNPDSVLLQLCLMLLKFQPQPPFQWKYNNNASQAWRNLPAGPSKSKLGFCACSPVCPHLRSELAPFFRLPETCSCEIRLHFTEVRHSNRSHIYFLFSVVDFRVVFPFLCCNLRLSHVGKREETLALGYLS